MKPQIEFSEFLEIQSKLEIALGRIIDVQSVPKSKLLNLTVKFGEETKTCLTNIGDHLNSSPGHLLDQTCLFVTNLKPSIMKGIESQVMIVPGNIEKNGFIIGTDPNISLDGEIIF